MGVAVTAVLDSVPGDVAVARTKKPAACFTIGKATCDTCCYKKRKLSKERTKQKQLLKNDLAEITARAAKLEEENRLLRAGEPITLEENRRTKELEAENAMLRQRLIEQQAEVKSPSQTPP